MSEEDGRFLRVLIAARGAKSILEIGAASGYSGIWLGLGARESGGRVVAIEYDPQRAKEAAANITRAGLTDVVQVVHGDAFKEIPKLPGTFDFVFLDAWKPDYKKFFDMVFPRLNPGGVFTAHNVVNKKSEMEPFLNTVQSHSGLFTSDRLAIGGGDSVSVQDSMRPVHIIGVPLDLGGARRGVDMGPSAFRIAGLGDRISELGRAVVDQGDLPSADSRNAARSRSDARSTSTRSLACAAASTRWRCRSHEAGALPLVLGGDHSLAAGSVAASADFVRQHDLIPARPDLGRRARRHEHATDDDHRQRPRDAAGGAARTGAVGAGGDRVVAIGTAAAHRARRHPKSRREGKAQDPRLWRPCLHDEGHRSRRHRDHRRTRDRAGVRRHWWRARLIRHGCLRSDARTRRRHAGHEAGSTTAKRTW